MIIFKDVEVFNSEAKVTRSRVYNSDEEFNYRYAMRHPSSNWAKPSTIEKNVVVDFYGSIFFKEKLKFSDDYIELSEDDIYNIVQALD